MEEKQKKRASKFLSLVLRHQPELIGLAIDSHGWMSVDKLLKALKHYDKAPSLTFAQLHEVIETNTKKRFELGNDGKLIRARQGHSIKVDLGYQEMVPPSVLYHGTATKNLDSIYKIGLVKGDRHDVHLSETTKTARSVGMRHGRPVVLIVDAQKMHEDGHVFFRTRNDVWLTDCVPVEYLAQDT